MNKLKYNPKLYPYVCYTTSRIMEGPFACTINRSAHLIVFLTAVLVRLALPRTISTRVGIFLLISHIIFIICSKDNLFRKKNHASKAEISKHPYRNALSQRQSCW